MSDNKLPVAVSAVCWRSKEHAPTHMNEVERTKDEELWLAIRFSCPLCENVVVVKVEAVQ